MSLALGLGALTACTSSGTTEQAGDKASGEGAGAQGNNEASGEKIKIRLLTRMAGTSDIVKVYNGVIDEFNGIRKNGKYLPCSGCGKLTKIYR